MTRSTLPRLVLAASLASAVSACSGDTAGPTTSARVAFHLTTAPAGAAPGLAFAGDTLVGAAPDTLVIDSVRLVLRDIRFKRVDDDSCDDHDDIVLAASHDDDDEDGWDDGDDHGWDDDACEYFNAGPFLLDLPLGGGVERVFSVAVDTGSYDELRIKIHKPEDDGDPLDDAFLASHPEFQDVSIRAFGSYNGSPWVYTTDLSAEQRMDLVPPIVVSGALTQVDVTIRVDVASWFADGSGGYVDPATANEGGAFEDLVEDNIERSFDAFRDEDHDGHDDDDDDGDDSDDD